MIRMGSSAFRVIGIGMTFARYRLDELLELVPGLRVLKWVRALLPAPRDAEHLSRGHRLRLALESLGPLFVKFGQILSTRRDLLPPDVAEALALLQDRVAPFSGEEARASIEAELGKPINEVFADFDLKPLASASIAQVHAATLKDGSAVVIKVLRPKIQARIAADLGILKQVADLVSLHAPSASKWQPREVVAEIERTLASELDLQREGANLTYFARHFKDSNDVHVPHVHWDYSSERVLTMERVDGIPIGDLAALDAAGIDRVKLAEKGVRLFYIQVFKNNFFHADSHPGNIWVDRTRIDEPRFILLDFGIVGSLPELDRRYLAENFRAMFQNDYRRIAELHLEAGWMPSHIRVDELEAGVRSVCEPYFTKPLAEISLGEVLAKIFKLAHRYELTIQPQLLLLQKTLLNIEGVGRQLHPKLDLFAVAKPVLEDIMRKEYGLQSLIEAFQKRLPEIVDEAPGLPRLIHQYLNNAAKGDTRIEMRSREIAALVSESREIQRRTVLAIIGSGLLVAAALLYALGAQGPQWLGFSLPILTATVGAVIAFFAALHRRSR